MKVGIRTTAEHGPRYMCWCRDIRNVMECTQKNFVVSTQKGHGTNREDGRDPRRLPPKHQDQRDTLTNVTVLKKYAASEENARLVNRLEILQYDSSW